MTTLSIVPVSHNADLCDIYPNQGEPQACFIALDLRTGRMSAQTNPEIGNAVPMDVWHGLVRRYYMPRPPLAVTANALMQNIAKHAQTILDHAAVVWDGNNNVVRTHERKCDLGRVFLKPYNPRWECDCPIALEEQAIEAVTSSLDEEDSVSLIEAGDWFDFSGADEYVARVEAGESIEDVAASIEQEIDALNNNNPNEYWAVMGIQEYLLRSHKDNLSGT